MGHRSLRTSAPAKPSRGAVALFAVAQPTLPAQIRLKSGSSRPTFDRRGSRFEADVASEAACAIPLQPRPAHSDLHVNVSLQADPCNFAFSTPGLLLPAGLRRGSLEALILPQSCS